MRLSEDGMTAKDLSIYVRGFGCSSAAAAFPMNASMSATVVLFEMPKNSSHIAESMASPAEWRQSSRPPRGSRHGLWLGLLVFAVAVGTMSRICGHEFTQWDDTHTIAANPLMNPPKRATIWYYWSHSEFGLWIPGTEMVLAGLAKLGRLSQPDDRGVWLNPWVFHTASVLLHGLAAVVLFALLKRLLEQDQAANASGPRARGTDCPGHSLAAAAFGAMVFAVHPVQVEAVAWASGLKDILCGLMTIVALWQYVTAAQSQERRLQIAHYLVATLSLGFAMLCKPTAMVAPAMAVVIDVLILRRRSRQVFGWTALWWMMGAGIAVIAKVVQPGIGIATVSWYLRPLVALDALAFYVGKLVWPAHLAFDYGRTPLVALRHGWLYVTWMVPVMIVALGLWKRSRFLIAGLLIFVIGLGPVLGLARFMFEYYSTVADHYLYLPMIGTSIIVAWAMARFWRPWLGGLAAATVLALAVRSYAQAGNWSDNQTLCSHAIALNPDSFGSYNNLGVSMDPGDYSRLPEQEIRARRLRAVRFFRESLEARMRMNGGIDDDVDPHLNMANIYLKLGRPDMARIQHMAALEVQRDRPPELRQHVFELTRDIAHDNRLLGNYDEAMKYLELAAKMRPNDATVRQEREAIQAAMGKK